MIKGPDYYSAFHHTMLAGISGGRKMFEKQDVFLQPRSQPGIVKDLTGIRQNYLEPRPGFTGQPACRAGSHHTASPCLTLKNILLFFL
jgi:hypothetical protein